MSGCSECSIDMVMRALVALRRSVANSGVPELPTSLVNPLRKVS